MKRKAIIVILALVLVFTLSACKATDVIGKGAVSSFETVLNTAPDKIKFDTEYNGWTLEFENGERFLWGKDFSVAGKPDLMIDLNVKPFIDAGLDISKLPTDMYLYDSMMDMLMIHAEIGDHPFEYKGEATPAEAFKHVVEKHRDIVGYHEQIDHYGVVLGNGHLFEWAKDISTNASDIEFVLNPQPFIDAGVDPTKIEGWELKKIEMHDENNKTFVVDKLVKTFSIK